VKRRVPLLVAGVASVALVVSASAPFSSATSSGSGSSYAAAAQAGTVAAITPTVKACGLSLLGILGSCSTGVLSSISTSLLGSLLAPTTGIVSDIQAVPSSIASALAGGGLSASNSSAQLSRPNPQTDASGTPYLPTCGQGGWDASGAGNCYTGAPVTVPASALLGLNVSGVGGYATDDSSGYVGTADTTGVTLSLLGTSIGNLGAIWASAQCPNGGTGSCQASNSAVSGSFFSGAVTTQIASAGSTQVVKVNGASLVNGATATPNIAGIGVVTVGLTNQLLKLQIPLSTTQLKTLLPTLSGLLSLVSVTGTVTVAIGPGSTSTSSGASASGLTVAADLSLDVKISTLGVASVEVTAGGSISSPDLLNLSLGYASAAAGSAQGTWIDPGTI
jgi:hypothetical protein